MQQLEFPLTLAPTGMVPTKDQNPALPVTPKEIAQTVKRCSEKGITTVHIHARDESGAPTWEKKYFEDIIMRVRSEAPSVLINVTTSGRNWSDLEKRADVLSLDEDTKPDIASLTPSSLNFLSGASVNAPETVRALSKIMLDRGIIPELEIFDVGMINAAKVLVRENLLTTPLLANLFLGNVFSAQATPGHLSQMIADLPEGTIWSGAGIGAFNLDAYALALASGGGVRAGLEDGLTLRRSGVREQASNEELVERVIGIASSLDRRPMSGQKLKSELLGKR